jgi:hypothetical protein
LVSLVFACWDRYGFGRAGTIPGPARYSTRTISGTCMSIHLHLLPGFCEHDKQDTKLVKVGYCHHLLKRLPALRRVKTFPFSLSLFLINTIIIRCQQFEKQSTCVSFYQPDSFAPSNSCSSTITTIPSPPKMKATFFTLAVAGLAAAQNLDGVAPCVVCRR